MQLELLPQHLPAPVAEAIGLINNLGFRVGLIGGVTRTFLLNGSISPDIDCELRHISGKVESSHWSDLYQTLSKKYQTELLTFEVINVKMGEYELDLNRPRIEIFNQQNHHRNFTPKFIPDTEYQLGFKRRDFTVNAIMLELYQREVKVYDPLNGIGHLKQRILEKCSEDFDRDPVRLLRALRFKWMLDMKLSESILQILKNVDGIAASSHYFKSEFQKSGQPLQMLWDYIQYDSSLQKLIPFQNEVERFFQFLGDQSVFNLCQSVVLSEVDESIKDRVLQLFGVAKSKLIRVQPLKFDTQIMQLEYSNEEFKQWIDWLDPFVAKLPPALVSQLLARSNVILSSEQIEKILVIPYQMNMDGVDLKLRKYFRWKWLLDQR